MKTNSVMELLKAKGVRVDQKPDSPNKPQEVLERSKPKRTRLYHFDESANGSTPIEALALAKESLSQTTSVDTLVVKSGQIELDSIKTASSFCKDSISPAIRQHQDSESSTFRQQLDSISPAFKTASAPGENELDSIYTAESPASRQQLDSTPRSFFEIVGKEREFLIFIFQQMVFQGGNSTRPISTDELKVAFGLSAKRLGNIVERTIAKGALVVEKGQRGRASWRMFSLPKNIYQEIRSELGSQKQIRQQLDSIYTAESPAESPASAPSSSRDLYIKESTTTPSGVTADLISTLDLTQLREFGITHDVFKRALQLYPNAPFEGLHELAFRIGELFKNPVERKKIQNARGFVIKLVEQLASGITPLDHIETPTDRLMREYAQAARAKRVELQGFEDTLLQEAFAKWEQELADEERFRAVPLAKSAPAGAPRMAVLREHFREKVWPETREKLLRGES
jgi:hypothetical protein